ncbi:MAG: hypothetical protein JXR66_04755 [Bacteroidales bacterium]|nr:hypothetical protein [Bacteroidales bacterium]MBN2632841.1 hypothetical protein [Bacteroidales bacterium]
MEEVTIINSRTGTDRKAGRASDHDSVNYRSGTSTSFTNLISQCGINFFMYLKNLNIPGRTDILVLPSNSHYYYDGKELGSIKVLINLKKLNLIKHIDLFLNMLVRVLPAETEFIGCFSESDSARKGTQYFGKYSKLFSRFLSLFDPAGDRAMDRDEVKALLQRCGFMPVDMREMNGLTYFCCRSTGIPHN